jgi:site-specific recombinase XerD
MHLKVGDIDTQNYHYLIVVGKGNKERVVPILAAELATDLRRRVEMVKSGYLWLNEETGLPIKDLRSLLYWAAKRAGINRHINPHLLRHSFGAHATAAGISLRALQDIMGHSTPAVTQIYSQVAAETLRKEMGKFSDYLQTPQGL